VNLKLWQIEHFIDILSLHLSIPLLFVWTYNITGMADVFQFFSLGLFRQALISVLSQK